MFARRGYHWLFGFTVVALATLGVWWLVFFQRAIDFERRAKLNDLMAATRVSALRLGHGSVPPELGKVVGRWPLEIADYERAIEGDIFSRLVPRHPQLIVRPTAQVLHAIEARMQRRWRMVVGEGGLLMVLLGLCTFMLYRLVRQERHSLKAMEIFLSAVSHEMKTPIAGIKTMLQTFAAGRVPADQAQKLYAMALKEAERLEHMIENVLLSGRARAGALQTLVEPMSLRSALDRFVDHRRRHLVDRPDAISLLWDLPGDDVQVMADSSALRVILENLCDNAFKYGGERPQVAVRVQTGAPQGVAVSVEDAGIGFAPEQADAMFAPFRRNLQLDSAIQHGTGLGLSIARRLARDMKGDLVASSPGRDQGSRFTVYLKEAPR